MHKNTIIIIVLVEIVVGVIFMLRIISKTNNENLYQNVQKIGLSLMVKKDSSKYIKKLIEINYPLIKKKNLDDWEKVNILRQWAYENTYWGYKSTLLNSIWTKEAPEIYGMIQHKSGGFDCGKTSYWLMKLYKLYGFEAYTYDSATDKTGWAHSITLVRINYQGVKKLIVEDATFNISYVDEKGNPIEFYELLTHIKNIRKNPSTDTINLLITDKPRHFLICNPKDGCGTQNTDSINKLRNGLIEYPQAFSLNYMVKGLYIFLFPNSIHHQSPSNRVNAEEIIRNVKKILDNNDLSIKTYY